MGAQHDRDLRRQLPPRAALSAEGLLCSDLWALPLCLLAGPQLKDGLGRNGLNTVGSLGCCFKEAHGESKDSARTCLGQVTLQTQSALWKWEEVTWEFKRESRQPLAWEQQRMTWQSTPIASFTPR